MTMTLKVTRFGNSKVLRIPREILRMVNADEVGDRFSLDVKDNKIILEKKKTTLEDYFKGYENQKYPFEVANKGGAVGKELY